MMDEFFDGSDSEDDSKVINSLKHVNDVYPYILKGALGQEEHEVSRTLNLDFEGDPYKSMCERVCDTYVCV